jgi:nitroimidazol reductase NimA-like FMN-containing flavoprotein (pyridoxamine 5'-phosphate oxidase superfamily)
VSDLAAVARAILDEQVYLTLGTADAAGRPWVSPVWYAHEAYTELFWASSPDAIHSRNVAARPEVAVVVFDSGAAVGTGQAVYIAATAGELAGDALGPHRRQRLARSARSCRCRC